MIGGLIATSKPLGVLLLAGAYFIGCMGRAMAGEDSFDLRQDSQKLHVVTSFAGSLFATEFLEWRGVSTWKATAAGSLLAFSAGLLKEYALDAHPSSTDLKADGIGIGGNLLAQFTIHFSWTGSSLLDGRNSPQSPP